MHVPNASTITEQCPPVLDPRGKGGTITAHSKESIEARLEELTRQFGDWSYDIPLPHGVWTKGNLKLPHTRLKRIVQIVNDLCAKPLSECRVLDLGCLEGLFSIEFASQGAETVGIEIREANIQKALFCKEVLGLENLTFLQGDVRNINLESHGRFDAIICSGILYHLPAPDVIKLVETMYAMANRLVVIDTHIALQPTERLLHDGVEYSGEVYREHADQSTQEEKAKGRWASWDNCTSFWFTRPSLINMLSRTGFSSVYECFVPAHINYGRPGIEHQNRCTFVAVKDHRRELCMSLAANELHEDWPEGTLSYAPSRIAANSRTSLFRRILSKMGR